MKLIINYHRFFLIVLCTFTFTIPVFAEEETIITNPTELNETDATGDLAIKKQAPGKPIQNGISGILELGFFATQTNGDSTSGEPPGMPMPRAMFNIKYGDEEAGREFSLGTPLQGLGESIKLAMSQSLYELGRFRLGVAYSYLARTEKDSYARYYDENTESEFTNERSIEYSFQYENILNSNLQFEYKYLTVNVSDDEDLTYSDDLARDGVVQSILIAYNFNLDRNKRISPTLQYTNANMEGASNSYNGYQLGLQHSFNIDRDEFKIQVGGGYNDYSKENPVFSKERYDLQYSLDASYRIRDLFGWENTNSSIIIESEYLDSNIDYLDKQTTSVGMTVGINF